VNPSDEAVMKEHKEVLKKMFDGTEKIEVIGDSSIESGGCVVETDLIKVDARPSSQLEAAHRALLGEAEQ
jgi:flagellar biosynthesis/type III secretory pathway protein FliH